MAINVSFYGFSSESQGLRHRFDSHYLQIENKYIFYLEYSYLIGKKFFLTRSFIYSFTLTMKKPLNIPKKVI